ncbi:MmgE/PrpD family protein [Thiocapsa rosea]|uniref:2-methylcitrate dehydratase PrpD n=1 Tax=Thiocapsa rosea TaxID=69360 RepID=A0A495V817_9GAMM|nr:MmgE/PrpD family protein [Thiocapsa rosea]RKT45552.1 2-methylcitrate dehydratase PrpD [Thiocapsa rosea]
MPAEAYRSACDPMTDNLTQQFVARLQVLADGRLAGAEIQQAKRCLLDYIGAALAGAAIIRPQAEKLLAHGYETKGGSTVIGFGARAGLETATLVNGLSSHVAEMDDGVRFGMIHPGSPIFSCLLPAAERYSVQASDLIKGIVIGYDAALRLASAIQPSHYQRGYHPTATCGTIGAAMGLGAMLGFDPQEMGSTFAAACVSASGSLKVVDDGSELKPYNAGRAAVVGLLSAQMARAGFGAPPDALSGEAGFLAMMCDGYDVERLIEPSSAGFWIHQVYVKPYAACRHAHPSIEACLRLRERIDLNTDQISGIRVTTYKGLVGRHDHRTFTNVASARMSIPYGVAVALVYGRAGIGEFTDETISNPTVRALALKVEVVSDDAFTAWVPEKRAARVEITLKDGTVYEDLVEYPKGEPENPMTDRELEDKFFALSEYGGHGPESSRMIVETVWNLPDNLEQFFSQLRHC